MIYIDLEYSWSCHIANLALALCSSSLVLSSFATRTTCRCRFLANFIFSVSKSCFLFEWDEPQHLSLTVWSSTPAIRLRNVSIDKLRIARACRHKVWLPLNCKTLRHKKCRAGVHTKLLFVDTHADGGTISVTSQHPQFEENLKGGHLSTIATIWSRRDDVEYPRVKSLSYKVEIDMRERRAYDPESMED